MVHLLILQELMGLRRGGRVIAKGGVNLRFFFGSTRYSQDMDLDGATESSAAIRSCLKGIFEDAGFTRRLRRFGIRGLDPGEGPNKDTETTFRYKFGVLVGEGVRYPTRVEVSFRARHPEDRAVLESPHASILEAYGLGRMEVLHYVCEAAVRQKLEALAGRREAQARDVFDLYVLLVRAPRGGLWDFLANTVPRERLEEAYGRAVAITYKEYEGQVFEFLGEEARSSYATERAWDEIRLRVATLIEDVLKRLKQLEQQ
ncbi:MAG: nucleotidyl transferase AbiEii/AbiGii toxin family protein [Gemmatimonadota bacterium]